MSLLSVMQNFKLPDSERIKLCRDVFDNVSLQVQLKKMRQNGITEEKEIDDIISQLRTRPAILVQVADELRKTGHNIRTFAEVGTAQGMQSAVFSKLFPESRVYTCDIVDERGDLLRECENVNFVLGDSLVMNEEIKKNNDTIDFCWIDGAHDHYSVLDDFLSLNGLTHDLTVWAFDDYDKRFGCFHDLNLLIRHFKEYVVLNIGKTASGNPNIIVLAQGLK